MICKQANSESRVIMTKKNITRVDMKIVRRIVKTLYENGPTLKSHLGIKSSLSYGQVTRYLSWMKSMDLVTEYENEDQVMVISLTKKAKAITF